MTRNQRINGRAFKHPCPPWPVEESEPCPEMLAEDSLGNILFSGSYKISSKTKVGIYDVYIYIPRGPAEAVAFFVRQSGPLSRTADMPESSAGNTDRQELMSLRRPPGWICV